MVRIPSLPCVEIPDIARPPPPHRRLELQRLQPLFDRPVQRRPQLRVRRRFGFVGRRHPFRVCPAGAEVQCLAQPFDRLRIVRRHFRHIRVGDPHQRGPQSACVLLRIVQGAEGRERSPARRLAARIFKKGLQPVILEVIGSQIRILLHQCGRIGDPSRTPIMGRQHERRGQSAVLVAPPQHPLERPLRVADRQLVALRQPFRYPLDISIGGKHRHQRPLILLRGQYCKCVERRQNQRGKEQEQHLPMPGHSG
jgi:hypothetical protein